VSQQNEIWVSELKEMATLELVQSEMTLKAIEKSWVKSYSVVAFG